MPITDVPGRVTDPNDKGNLRQTDDPEIIALREALGQAAEDEQDKVRAVNGAVAGSHDEFAHLTTEEVKAKLKASTTDSPEYRARYMSDPNVPKR